MYLEPQLHVPHRQTGVAAVNPKITLALTSMQTVKRLALTDLKVTLYSYCVRLSSTDDGADDDGFAESAGWGDTDYGADHMGDSDGLLEAPRKVEKISVTYAKASKQVHFALSCRFLVIESG